MTEKPGWRLKTPLQELLIIRSSGQSTQAPGESVPGLLLVAELDRWLASVFSRRVCQELYEVVTGMGSGDLLLHQPSDRTQQLKQRLARAFRDGELLAVPLGPPRLRSGGGGGTTPTAPMAVPLLPDSMAVKDSASPTQQPKEQEQKQTEQSWVAFELVDEEGTPIADVRYRVLLPNGEVREGTLDAQGQAILEGIAEGTCKIFFPDLDDSDESQGSESGSGEEDDL